MKYFIDTEFYEDGKTIELISIGIVAENGREFVAYNSEFNLDKALNDPWHSQNVTPYLPPKLLPDGLNYKKNPRWKTRAEIRADILEFIGNDTAPQFVAYYADYDWIVFCQLWGRMVDLPNHFPMYCIDVKQLADEMDLFPIPIRDADPEHCALADARWCREAYNFLSLRGSTSAMKWLTELRPEVKTFAVAMEKVLRANDHKGGWEDMCLEDLTQLLIGEVDELRFALVNNQSLESVQKEAVDAGNYTMMIFDQALRELQKRLALETV